MARIAIRAGVSRQTIYRWWPSKADVMLDAVNVHALADVPSADLVAFVRTTYTIAPAWVPILRALMAEALQNPRFERRFRREFLSRRRALLQSIVRRELPEADPDLVADHVFGPLWYLVLTRPAALTSEYASYILETLPTSSLRRTRAARKPK